MINNYDEFTKEYALFQRDRPKGIGLAKTLLIKEFAILKFGISENCPFWKVPLEVLNEILNKCKRSK